MTIAFILYDSLRKVQKSHAAKREGSFNFQCWSWSKMAACNLDLRSMTMMNIIRYLSEMTNCLINLKNTYWTQLKCWCLWLWPIFNVTYEASVQLVTIPWLWNKVNVHWKGITKLLKDPLTYLLAFPWSSPVIPTRNSLNIVNKILYSHNYFDIIWYSIRMFCFMGRSLTKVTHWRTNNQQQSTS